MCRKILANISILARDLAYIQCFYTLNAIQTQICVLKLSHIKLICILFNAYEYWTEILPY